jgi:hypothetical protein
MGAGGLGEIVGAVWAGGLGGIATGLIGAAGGGGLVVGGAVGHLDFATSREGLAFAVLKGALLRGLAEGLTFTALVGGDGVCGLGAGAGGNSAGASSTPATAE